MIVLGNAEFAMGMKLAGLKGSHIIRRREDALKIIEELDAKEFILANVSIIALVPELKEFQNLVSIPDDPEEFSSTDDLQEIIKSAVGIEITI